MTGLIESDGVKDDICSNPFILNCTNGRKIAPTNGKLHQRTENCTNERKIAPTDAKLHQRTQNCTNGRKNCTNGRKIKNVHPIFLENVQTFFSVMCFLTIQSIY
jgi:hypothetical protein